MMHANKTKIIFMFSGQGSHYYRMGEPYMQNHKVFADWMQTGDSILASLGYPNFLKTLYGKDKNEPWQDLIRTHPGLVITEYATFQLLKSLGIYPDVVSGFSIGELAAAAVAGFCSFEEAVEAALKQAELIIEHCPLGGMTAVLGSPDLYRNSEALQGLVYLAGVNFDQHFMISGVSSALKEAETILKSNNVTHQSLHLNYAFHSPEILMAQEAFTHYCRTEKKLTFAKSAEVDFISGVRASKLDTLPDSYFWDVVAEPILFQQTISDYFAKGQQNNIYVDLGPAGTLATFVKYNLGSAGWPLLTPFSRDSKNLEALQHHLNTL